MGKSHSRHFHSRESPAAAEKGECRKTCDCKCNVTTPVPDFGQPCGSRGIDTLLQTDKGVVRCRFTIDGDVSRPLANKGRDASDLLTYDIPLKVTLSSLDSAPCDVTGATDPPNYDDVTFHCSKPADLPVAPGHPSAVSSEGQSQWCPLILNVVISDAAAAAAGRDDWAQILQTALTRVVADRITSPSAAAAGNDSPVNVSCGIVPPSKPGVQTSAAATSATVFIKAAGGEVPSSTAAGLFASTEPAAAAVDVRSSSSLEDHFPCDELQASPWERRLSPNPCDVCRKLDHSKPRPASCCVLRGGRHVGLDDDTGKCQQQSHVKHEEDADEDEQPELNYFDERQLAELVQKNMELNAEQMGCKSSKTRRLENGHDHCRPHVHPRSTEIRSKSAHRHLASAAADASVSPTDAKSPKHFPAFYCSGCAKRLQLVASEKWNKVDPVSSPQHHRTDPHVTGGLPVANTTNDLATASRSKHESKAAAAQSCHRWKEMKPISHYYRKHRKRELNHNRAMQQVAEWIETTGDGSGNVNEDVEIREFHRSTRHSSHGLTRHEHYVSGDDQCRRHEHYHYHYHFNVNGLEGKI